VRLISNVRSTFCSVLNKAYIAIPLPYMDIMETLYYLKINIGVLEQNSGIIIIHSIDRIFHLSSAGLIFLRKAYIIWG
jgi:hypothetical protein